MISIYIHTLLMDVINPNFNAGLAKAPLSYGMG